MSTYEKMRIFERIFNINLPTKDTCKSNFFLQKKELNVIKLCVAQKTKENKRNFQRIRKKLSFPTFYQN